MTLLARVVAALRAQGIPHFIADVEVRLAELPVEPRRLWGRVRGATS